MEKNLIWSTGLNWGNKLEKDFRSIEKLGPKAWEFLRDCPDFFNYTKSTKLYYEIYNKLYDNHSDMITFRASISNMQMISRIGWNKYKIFYSITHN
jgi:hypothetical protein